MSSGHRRGTRAMLIAAILGVIGGCGRGDEEGGDTQTVAQQSHTAIDTAAILAPAPMDSSAPSGTPRYSLQEAKQRGLIDYTVAGRGASSGGSLLLVVQRITDTPIDIYVAPGTTFLPGSGSAQRMVAWGVMGRVVVEADTAHLFPMTSIYLPSLDAQAFMVEAYCLDFHLENPSPQDRFVAAAEPDVRAAQILQESKKEGLSIRATQTAIWIDENHVTKQEIQTKFEASDQEVEDAFEMLKRLPRPPGT